MNLKIPFRSMLLTAVLLSGCGHEDGPITIGATDANASTAQADAYCLATEPAGAKGIIELRKDAQGGEEVVAVGRIGGSEQPIIQGRAAFTIVDLSVKPCEDCDRPWVYCCTPREELVPALVLVKLVDEQGQTVGQDARQLLGVKEGQVVVVRGQAKRDADGNLTAILATGLFIRQ